MAILRYEIPSTGSSATLASRAVCAWNVTGVTLRRVASRYVRCHTEIDSYCDHPFGSGAGAVVYGVIGAPAFTEINPVTIICQLCEVLISVGRRSEYMKNLNLKLQNHSAAPRTGSLDTMTLPDLPVGAGDWLTSSVPRSIACSEAFNRAG
jgi:hypothetical protein